MRHYGRIAFFLVLIIVLNSGIVFAATVTSKATGLWSSSSTWDLGRLPATGDNVVIAAGHHVTYDVNSPSVEITKMEIYGTLNFSRTTTTYLLMKGNLIVADGGKLEIGDPTKSIINTTTATIKFLLNEANVVGGFTNVVVDTDVGLWIMGEYRAEGAKKLPWTKLFETANAGAISILINEEPIGWAIGDEIVITPSRAVIPTSTEVADSGYNEFDERKITAVSRRIDGAYIISLNESLKFSHPVYTASTGDVLAPEVLNLDRNVIIRGQDINNKAHTMAMQSGKMWISNAKYLYMGPADKMSRYPIHWHEVNNASKGNYVKGTVVHRSQMRAFVAHESNSIDIIENIAYDILNGPFWLENDNVGNCVGACLAGSKSPEAPFNDTFIRNVAARVGPSKADGENEGLRLAGYEWQTPRGHKFMGNIAVGIRGTGSAAGFIWPERGQGSVGVLTFIKNEAHNDKINGIFLWHNTNLPHQYVDALVWHNGRDGLEQGAYHTEYKWFLVRAIGNGRAGISYPAVDSEFYDSIIDGEGITKIGFHALTEAPVAPNGPIKIANSVTKGYTVVAFSQIHNTCATEEFINTSSKCARVWRHLWDNDYGTGKHFDFDGHGNHFSQWNIYNYPAAPFNFILHRSDYPAGVYNSTWDANLLTWRYEPNNAPKRPTVTLASPTNNLVTSGILTLTATATDANKVEFLVDGEIVAADTTVPYSITWDFDKHRLPYAFIFARGVTNLANSSSLVAMIRKPPTGAIVPVFDFSLSAPSVSVTQGSSATNTITATLTGTGATQPVSFSVSGLPSGATPSAITSCSPTCTTSLTITTSPTTPVGSYVITVTGTGGGLTRITTFTLTLNAVAAFDFSLSNSGGITVTQGSSSSNTITATLLSGTTQSVSYTVSGLPSGATHSFSTTSCNPTCTTTLTITAASTTPAGTYTITVTGTSGTLTRATSFLLTVNLPFDFLISVSPASDTVTQGASTTTTLTASLSTGTTQPVSFACTGPTGVTCTFSPTTCSPTCSSTVTISTTSATPVGTHDVSIPGTGGSVTRTVTYVLQVDASPPACTLTSASITPVCSGGSSANCEAGETITMTGTYTGDCSAADFFQIDASGTGCNIQYTSGDISGISDSTITVSGGVVTGSWIIPSIPSTCAGKTVTAGSAALYDGGPPGTGTWLTSSSASGSFTLASLPAAFSFTLSNSGNVAVTQGSSGSNTITATLDSGITQLVTLTASGLPSGATATFVPSSGNPTFTSTLTIAAASTTPVGTSTITVTGIAGISGLTKMTTFTLTVNELVPTDITPPTVSITNPPANDIVFGSFNVTVEASDNVGVKGVEFYLDGILRKNDTVSPFDATINASRITNTTHTITARAYDDAGNANSYTITVTVDESRKIADVNADGDVDLADIIVMILAWSLPGSTDINKDGTTNLVDIGIMLSKWTG